MKMDDRVFCKGCHWFALDKYEDNNKTNNKLEFCLHKELSKKMVTPIEEIVVSADCSIHNSNNNCEFFEELLPY